MTFKDAQAEFAVRYYKWALDEFRQESVHGYPLIRKLRTQPSIAFIKLIEQLSIDEECALVAALVKRFHSQALEIVGGNISSYETKLLKKFSDSMLFSLPDEHDYTVGNSDERLPPKLKRKVFANLLKECLAPLFSSSFEKCGDGEWSYTNHFESIAIQTRIDVGGRFHQLGYSHNIVFSGYDLLVDHASILSWLGLSSQTHWQSLDEAKATETAHVLVEVCDCFLKAMPRLLEGLAS
jgi:hypothetical protein